MNVLLKGHFGSPLDPAQITQDMLQLNAFVNAFRAIERSIHFRGVEGRERNGEHTFQVGFMAKQMNLRARLGLNAELLGRMADAHDLVEVYAGGVLIEARGQLMLSFLNGHSVDVIDDLAGSIVLEPMG